MMYPTSFNRDDILLKNNHHHQNQIMCEEDHQEQPIIIINSSCPISWKLYDNPFFAPTNTTNHGSISNSNPNHTNNNPLKLKPKQLQRKYSATAKFLHSSDLKMNSHTSITTSNNNVASSSSSNGSSEFRTQVAELKAELEMERKQRKKMEALNKKLSRELVDQEKQMCVCDDLSKEVSRLKEEMETMKKEMDRERKMLRMAEVLREERVQMKLSDAHLFYHHHFLDHFLPPHQQKTASPSIEAGGSKKLALPSEDNNSKCLLNHGTVTTTGCSSNSSFSGRNVNVQRKASPEAENPHIKQGIKGFVEFQRAIKAKNGCSYGTSYNASGGIKQSRDVVGSYNKLECQKAQLRVLFKNKYPLPYSNHDHLILS